MSVDAIGNLMMTLPGRDRSAPRILIGSHLDSVPAGRQLRRRRGRCGGSVARCPRCGRPAVVPAVRYLVMGIRAEESAWFDVAYIGSAGAFGLLDPACLSVRRSDDGPSLDGDHSSARLRSGRRFASGAVCSILRRSARTWSCTSSRVRRLPASGLPAAVVTGIRGCKRFRNARCLGEYAHSGAVNRAYPARCGGGHRGAAASSGERLAATGGGGRGPRHHRGRVLHRRGAARTEQDRRRDALRHRRAQRLGSHDGCCGGRGAAGRRAPRAGLSGRASISVPPAIRLRR